MDNNVVNIMRDAFAQLFGTPATAEQQREMRATGRNNSHVLKAWDIFAEFVRNGEPAGQAMRKTEEAIAAWQEYESKNWMEPPIIEPPPAPALSPFTTPPFPIPGTMPHPALDRSQPAQLFYGILGPGDGPHHNGPNRKVLESEPGVLKIFEYYSAALAAAGDLGEGHTVIVCAAQILGPADNLPAGMRA